MSTLLMSPAEQGIVVFHVWPSLEYKKRLALSFALIAIGLVWQVLSLSLFPGILFVLAGNVLLLVSGYNNLVDSKGFTAQAQWQTVEETKLLELKVLDKKIKRWDQSAVDITNPLGGLLFVVAAGLAAFGIIVGNTARIPWLLLLSANFAVLFIPHWITGIRSILTRPGLTLKIETFLNLLHTVGQQIEPDTYNFLMLLRGEGEKALPEDVKLRVKPEGSHEEFLGLQVQVSLNNVQGKSYVYLYVVAVARVGYGLQKYAESCSSPLDTVEEFSVHGDVEVLVVRQYTTKNTGYYTAPEAVRKIFLSGLELARKASKGPFS